MLSGDLKKRRMWPTMLCCALVKPHGEEKPEGGVPGRPESSTEECARPAMACAARLEGGMRLKRRSTAITHTVPDFTSLRHQSDY